MWASQLVVRWPVWSCSSYCTKQGHPDDYLLYLRSRYLATTVASKKHDQMIARRYAFRDLVGTKIVREVMLKPAP